MLHRGLILIACAMLVVTGFGAQFTRATAADPVTITMSTNVVGEQAKLLQTLAEKFTAENPDIKVDFSAPGKDYEAQMKVKMAANDLPDVFSTHGWAKIRYGEFLMDLRDEPWASKIDPAMKPIVTDESGKVYVLPLDEDKVGPVYNVDLFKEYGLKVPATWNELLAACDTIKAKSDGKVTPIHVGGADNWPLGHMVDLFSVNLLISPAKNQGQALLDGSFDWSLYLPMAQKLLELQSKCLNKDAVTAKYSDSAKAFAEGKAAIGVYGPFLIVEAKNINPKLNAGLMPVPALVESDTPTFSGGEKTTFGIWKDSKNKDAARKLLSFLAQPENVALVAASNQIPAGLVDVKVDLGDLAPYWEQYKDIRVFPYFDRVYLPNGLWPTLDTGAQDLLAGGITPEQYIDSLKKEYVRLRAATVATPESK